MIKTVVGAVTINLDKESIWHKRVLTLDEFDDEVNNLLEDGWTLNKRYTVGKTPLYFVAELSREENETEEPEEPEACKHCNFYKVRDGEAACTAWSCDFNIPFSYPPHGCPRIDELCGRICKK